MKVVATWVNPRAYQKGVRYRQVYNAESIGQSSSLRIDVNGSCMIAKDIIGRLATRTMTGSTMATWEVVQ